MKLTKSQLLKIIKEELTELGISRAMGEERYNSLEEGVQALIQNWNPETPEGQRYLDELQALSDQFQEPEGGEEHEYVTLRDPRRLGKQQAFEDKK